MTERPRAFGLERTAFALLAFALRAAYPDACFFGTDQVGTLLNGRAVLAGDFFVPGPGIGWSSFSLGPLFNQVAAIALSVRDEFADVVVLIAAVHALAVGFSHGFLRALLGERAGRFAAFTLAVHPVSVAMGCAPISSSLVLPTTLIYLEGVRRWSDERAPTGFALAAIGASLMVQAHVTTVLLLPLCGIGLYRRAPVGRAGLLGLVAAAAIAYPMVAHNLRQWLAHPDGVRHATGEGGAYVIALARAFGLDYVVASLAPPEAHPLGRAAQGLGIVTSAASACGLLLVAFGKSTRTARVMLPLGVLLPTVVVAALPRGALYYYLESTVSLRCAALGVLFASLCHELRDARFGRATRPLAFALASAMVAVSSNQAIGRRRALARGVLEVRFARVDLREPIADGEPTFGVPTLAAQRTLGEAFGAFGASRATLPDALHGPWRWMLGNSSWAFAKGANAGRASVPALYVRHDDDGAPAPAAGAGSQKRRAGAFTVFAFRDRAFTPQPGDARRLRIDGPGPFALGVIAPVGATLTGARVEGAAVPARSFTSVSGFVEHRVSSPWGLEVTAVELEFSELASGTPLVRGDADVYAFDAEASVPR